MRMDFALERLGGGMNVFEYFSNSLHFAESASWLVSDLQLVWETSLAKCCASICWNDQWRSSEVPFNPKSLQNDDQGELIGQFDSSLVWVAQPWWQSAASRTSWTLSMRFPWAYRGQFDRQQKNQISFWYLQSDFHEIPDALSYFSRNQAQKW